MKPGSIMRVVRPTDNLAAIVEMYVNGLGFTVIYQFTDHEGFAGAILGHPQQPHHFAFTSQHGHRAGTAPTKDNLLVFFLPAKRRAFGLFLPRIHTGTGEAKHSRTSTAIA